MSPNLPFVRTDISLGLNDNALVDESERILPAWLT